MKQRDRRPRSRSRGNLQGQIRRLDDVLAPDTTVDLVKIDVEQRELPVLRGMRRVIAESPCIVILFEKLVPRAGYEGQIEECLKELGLELFGILRTPICRL